MYNRCYLPRLTIEDPQGQQTTPSQPDETEEEEGDQNQKQWQRLTNSKRRGENEAIKPCKRLRLECDKEKEWGFFQPDRTNVTTFLMSSQSRLKRPTKYKQTQLRPFQSNLAKSKNDKQPVQANIEEGRKQENPNPEVAKVPTLEKRKPAYTLSEFNRDCKRMRPNFSPESEAELGKNERRKPVLSDPKSKIIFFSVFSKTNKKLNQEKMFKQTKPKPKLSSTTRKKKKPQSSTQLVQVRGRPDIRNFFEVGGGKPNNENCGKTENEDNHIHSKSVQGIREANSKKEKVWESL